MFTGKIKKALLPLVLLVLGLLFSFGSQPAEAADLRVYLDFPGGILYEGDPYIVKAKLVNADPNETYAFQWQVATQDWFTDKWNYEDMTAKNSNSSTMIINTWEGQKNNLDVARYRFKVTDSKGKKYYSNYFKCPIPEPKKVLDVVIYPVMNDIVYNQTLPTDYYSANEEFYKTKRLVWYKSFNDTDANKMNPNETPQAGEYSCRLYFEPAYGYKVDLHHTQAAFHGNDSLRFDERTNEFYIYSQFIVDEPIFLKKISLEGYPNDSQIDLAPGESITIPVNTDPVDATSWPNFAFSAFADGTQNYTVTPDSVDLTGVIPRSITITAGDKLGRSNLSAWYPGYPAPNRYGTWTINVTNDAPKTHYVTVNGVSGNEWSGEGTYRPGDAVALNAGTKPGYKFDHWTVDSNNATLDNPKSIHASFQMQRQDVTVTAHWVKDGTDIDMVNITVTPPKTGSKPMRAVCENPNCYIFSTQWTPDEARFGPNKEYKVAIQITSNPSYNFTSDTKFYINGEEVFVFAEQDNCIALQYTFPKTKAEEESPEWTNPFKDVDPSDYYYEPIKWALHHDPIITSGTSESTFSPENICTRGEAVTFIWRSKGNPTPEYNSNIAFKDVDPNEYYYKSVQWAVEQNIASGIDENRFGPRNYCTRAQIVTFLWRAAGSPAVTIGNTFSDVNPNAYYAQAVQWAVNNGITNGTGPDTFSPEAYCTRGQIVTFLYNAR